LVLSQCELFCQRALRIEMQYAVRSAVHTDYAVPVSTDYSVPVSTDYAVPLVRPAEHAYLGQGGIADSPSPRRAL
jgi:hypothetical protein